MFADDELLGLLLAERAVVDAKPVQSGRSTLVTTLSRLVPTLLIVGFFVRVGTAAVPPTTKERP